MSRFPRSTELDWSNYDNIVDFKQFLDKMGIDEDDERVPLLVKCWNQGVGSACDKFGNDEGTVHDADVALQVKE